MKHRAVLPAEGMVTQLPVSLHAVTCGSKEYLCPLINIWDTMSISIFLFPCFRGIILPGNFFCRALAPPVS